MSSGQEKQVTVGGKERIERTIETLAPAFVGDPFISWQLPAYSISDHKELLPKLFPVVFAQCGLCDGYFYEIDDYASCGILVPPGRSMDAPMTVIQSGAPQILFSVGLSSTKASDLWLPPHRHKNQQSNPVSQRMALTYPAAKKAALQRLLTKKEQKNHWYVYIMGTKSERRRQGLASALVEEMKKKAQTDGRPMFIEVTTEKSRDLYVAHGFEVKPEAVYILGKGEVDTGGIPQKGGAGVSIWPMVWRPSGETS